MEIYSFTIKLIPLKYLMHIYDAVTLGGLHVHLSMSENNATCYIFVNDIYANTLTMRFFTDMESAVEFIRSF